MVEVGRFVDELKAAGIGLFTGVPDSLLKSFCAYVTDTCGENRREKIGLTCFDSLVAGGVGLCKVKMV